MTLGPLPTQHQIAGSTWPVDPVENADAFPTAPTGPTTKGRGLIHHSGGRYLSWSFKAEQSCEAPVAALCEAVAMHGVAFMLANRDLTALTQTLSEGRLGISYQNEYRMSAALFLLGHRVEAEEKLESQLRQLCARNDPAAKSLRSFADRLRAAMSEGGTQPK